MIALDQPAEYHKTLSDVFPELSFLWTESFVLHSFRSQGNTGTNEASAPVSRDLLSLRASASSWLRARRSWALFHRSASCAARARVPRTGVTHALAIQCTTRKVHSVLNMTFGARHPTFSFLFLAATPPTYPATPRPALILLHDRTHEERYGVHYHGGRWFQFPTVGDLQPVTRDYWTAE